jgi:hypothetical protein
MEKAERTADKAQGGRLSRRDFLRAGTLTGAGALALSQSAAAGAAIGATPAGADGILICREYQEMWLHNLGAIGRALRAG